MATILVIDDDARDRELLAAVLEERGYEVVLAANGRIGLILCHRQDPDAVVLDLNMPKMTVAAYYASCGHYTPRSQS
jgi:two-component system, OmpR family, response regulator